MNLSDVFRAARRTVAPLSPRHRRWKKFLRGLDLDPEQLSRPLEAPGERDFIICGSPRTMTSLLSAMLFQPPGIVTVMEPWDGMRLPPARLFASLREEIGTTGVLRRGRLDIEMLSTRGIVQWCREGDSTPRLEAGSDYLLGVKWPGFWRYLELLPDTKFLVCVRHPFEVIASYKGAGGRVAQGLQYDTAFNRRLNQELQSATSDVAIRRILLFDYIHERIIPYLHRPNVFVVRCEWWFHEKESLMTKLGAFLGVELRQLPAIVRPPRNRIRLTRTEIDLIRKLCRTAEPLGYSLDSEPEHSSYCACPSNSSL